MSYDVGFKGITSNDTEIDIGLNSHNYTYNVSKVFYDVIPGGINSLNGMSTFEARPILEAALVKIEKNRAEYVLMLKDLEWGNIYGAENFLRKILSDCIQITDVRITMS